jgi:UDP-N-acetylmuramyl pentapeptide phosphotransferase/UDP-N-acetylglucosamine-1-phosphate transferase
VFSAFVVDATATLIERLLKGEKAWQAHRSHYYQKLVLMGWGHKKTALTEYVLMVAVGASAVWLIHHQFVWQMVGLAIWASLYVCVALWINHRWKRYNCQ